ncbi:MAG: DNA repair protein RadA [Bacteroidetes bacterium RBG_13_42_15]|nr:MAG: DNA repair protein RadA [Bacteroidetes bacterium RBG_13_42_15]
MKKSRSQFICQNCGYNSPRWIGKCPECEQWNTFAEELVIKRKTDEANKPLSHAPIPITQIPKLDMKRILTGNSEFDRVLGGGIVPGSAVLIAGAPGIGKSTLLLQIGALLASRGKNILYISGEESLEQIRLRADRLHIESDRFKLFIDNDLSAILTLMRSEKPDLAIVDSIQTIYNSDMESLPGNVSQVRSCGYDLTINAKESGIPLFMVGHVTKEGNIAGPRVLEHLVDGLFLFEGDDQHVYRLLRSVKNRFGSTNEVGIFEMTDEGIQEVKNPSENLISDRPERTPGTVVTVSLEGTRPLMVEVQALVSSTSYGIPQRIATGIDHRRVAILLAVLEKKVGLKFGSQDVFVSTAGGLKLAEPAVDLAVTIALVSSYHDKPVRENTAVLGEIGLTGEIRGIAQVIRRIGEAERIGFSQIILPKPNLKGLKHTSGIKLIGVQTLNEAIDSLF